MENKEQQSIIMYPIVRETSPLASIQKVHSPVAIDGRDQIVTATVLGYRVIVKKSDFFPDFDSNKESSSSSFSLCVFVQPDSLMDASNPSYAFLDGKRGRLVCTKKIFGIYSQGLCLPLSDLSFYGVDLSTNHIEGMDVTSLMKITKFVSSEEMSQYENIQTNSSGQSMMAAFPVEMVPKTNEPNLQSYTKYLQQIENRRVTVSLKLDGSSMTVTSDGKLCGRNFEWVEKNPSNKNYFVIEEKYNIKEKIKNSSYHVQGELVGPSIQKNPLGLKEIDFYVFNISSENHYLSHPQTVKKCEEWGFKSVPCLYNDIEVKNLPFFTVEDWLDFADKQVYPTNGKMAEGIVVKTSDDLEPRISFKVLSRKYVVK